MGFGQFSRNVLKTSLFILLAGFLVFLYGSSPVVAHDRSGLARFLQGRYPAPAMDRERFLASREGLQFGVPKQALAHAKAQMLSMKASHGAASAAIAGPASTQIFGNWNFIGPLPSSEEANFSGSPIGSFVNMTGRVTALGADRT